MLIQSSYAAPQAKVLLDQAFILGARRKAENLSGDSRAGGDLNLAAVKSNLGEDRESDNIGDQTNHSGSHPVVLHRWRRRHTIGN